MALRVYHRPHVVKITPKADDQNVLEFRLEFLERGRSETVSFELSAEEMSLLAREIQRIQHRRNIPDPISRPRGRPRLKLVKPPSEQEP